MTWNRFLSASEGMAPSYPKAPSNDSQRALTFFKKKKIPRTSSSPLLAPRAHCTESSGNTGGDKEGVFPPAYSPATGEIYAHSRFVKLQLNSLDPMRSVSQTGSSSHREREYGSALVGSPYEVFYYPFSSLTDEEMKAGRSLLAPSWLRLY